MRIRIFHIQQKKHTTMGMLSHLEEITIKKRKLGLTIKNLQLINNRVANPRINSCRRIFYCLNYTKNQSFFQS